jgi:hypothetical protein
MQITLTNDFHNTTVTIRAASLPHTMTVSQTRRVRNALCGRSGCKCGGVRGPQQGLNVEEDYSADGFPVLKVSSRAVA